MSQPSMAYGFPALPSPLVTPFAAVKFASESMRIGVWGVSERPAIGVGAAVTVMAGRRTDMARGRLWPPPAGNPLLPVPTRGVVPYPSAPLFGLRPHETLARRQLYLA